MSAAIVLAGGRGRRFGGDKTRATVAGISLLERVTSSVATLVDEIVVVGPWAPLGARSSPEPSAFNGPLPALAHGLSQVSAERALVLGADHPLLVPALLELVMGRHSDAREVDATIPRRSGRAEPLVGCYSTRSVGELANQLVGRGEGRLHALLDAVRVQWVDEQDWRRVDPNGRSFLDVDTTRDLAAVRALSGPER